MIFLAEVLGMMMTLVVYGSTIFIISFGLWMAIDAGKQDRFWWIVLIVGIPFIGPAVYFFTEKKHEYAKAPVHHVHTSETEEQHEVTPKKLAHHTNEAHKEPLQSEDINKKEESSDSTDTKKEEETKGE